MLLYLVFDTQTQRVTPPILANDLEEAYQALKQINPENLSNLIIHPLLNINDSLDLFLLSIDSNKELPAFLTTRSGDHIADPTSECALALHE